MSSQAFPGSLQWIWWSYIWWGYSVKITGLLGAYLPSRFSLVREEFLLCWRVIDLMKTSQRKEWKIEEIIAKEQRPTDCPLCLLGQRLCWDNGVVCKDDHSQSGDRETSVSPSACGPRGERVSPTGTYILLPALFTRKKPVALAPTCFLNRHKG